VRADDTTALTALTAGDGPLGVSARPSGLKRDRDGRATSTGEKAPGERTPESHV
jgi:hypothetical protein